MKVARYCNNLSVYSAMMDGWLVDLLVGWLVCHNLLLLMEFGLHIKIFMYVCCNLCHGMVIIRCQGIFDFMR
jgi:hypothetical protein